MVDVRVSSKGTGVNVRMPGCEMPCTSYINGTRGHAWLELRYWLHFLGYKEDPCDWVRNRKAWLRSEWVRAYDLPDAELHRSDKSFKFLGCPSPMPSKEFLASIRWAVAFVTVMAVAGKSAQRCKCRAFLASLLLAVASLRRDGVSFQVPVAGGDVDMVPVYISRPLGEDVAMSVGAEALFAMVGSPGVLEAVPACDLMIALEQGRARDARGAGDSLATLTAAVASMFDVWLERHGIVITTRSEDTDALLPRLQARKRYRRVDHGTLLTMGVGSIKQKRARSAAAFIKANKGGSRFAGVSSSSAQDTIVGVVRHAIAWARDCAPSVGNGGYARVAFSADEATFNGMSCLIAIVLDMVGGVVTYAPLQACV